VTYARGCNICDIVPPGYPNMPCPPGQATNTSGFPAAVAAASAADVAVVFVGLDQTSEAENFDRDVITLPGVQESLVQAILAVQPRTVVVLMNGGIVSSPWMAANVPAILEAWYGGELGGDAVIDALGGAYSPAGRMPVTTYFPNVTQRDVRDVDLASSGGITYQYFTGPVLWPFGWGLSYTTFTYAWADAALGALSVRDTAAEVPLTVNVTNNGTATSDCVVMAFVAPPTTTSPGPSSWLAGFTRLPAIAPGETRQWTWWLQPSQHLGRVDEEGRRGVLTPGRYAVRIGDVVSPAVLDVEVAAAGY
jgi:hypothetical protein